eukprot:NODE_505_length_7533_cov_0.471886.p5 type:complete len:148 gc:universal NODE_505_length_7533_cov_0.471886:2755-2312(-)
MDGRWSLAIWKRDFTSFSDSPIHFETKSDEDTAKKVEFASVATALARYDLPVPGGPNKRIPFQGCLVPVKRCGNRIGSITASFKLSFAASKPATSSHFTFGFSCNITEFKLDLKSSASWPWLDTALPFFVLSVFKWSLICSALFKYS